MEDSQKQKLTELWGVRWRSLTESQLWELIEELLPARLEEIENREEKN